MLISEMNKLLDTDDRYVCVSRPRRFGKTKEMESWYDGYCVDGIELYSPKSVVEAVSEGQCGDYWTATGSCEAIRQIKEKRYGSDLELYKGNMLLVGINYDSRTKKHKCIIERA